MTIVVRNDERIVVELKSALSQMTLALDKRSGRGSLARNTLMWKRKPREFDLGAIEDVGVARLKDGSSGVVLHQAVIKLSGDETLPVPAADEEAEATAQALREFLGLKAA